MRLIEDLDSITFKIGWYNMGDWSEVTLTAKELSYDGGELEGTELFYAFQDAFTLKELLSFTQHESKVFKANRDIDGEIALIVRL